MLLALLSSTYAQWGQRHLLVLQILESCKTTAWLQLRPLSWTKRKEYESRKSGQCDWLNGACSEVAAYGVKQKHRIKNTPSLELKFLEVIMDYFRFVHPTPKKTKGQFFPPKKSVLATLATYKVATSGSPTC